MSNFIHSRAERERIKADKEEKILSFLLEETYSTSEIISKLLNTTQTTAYRTLKKMEKNDLVRLHVIGLDLGRVGKQAIWGLTPTGALIATDPDMEDFKVDYFEVGKVKPITMAHSFALQRAKVSALNSGWTNWLSSLKMQQLANKDRSVWLQVPDAVAYSPEKVKTAIELERTVKTPKRYDEILSKYAQMLNSGTVDQVIYICPDKIAPRLAKLFKNIKKINLDGNVEPVSEELLSKFSFLSYQEWAGESVLDE